MRGEAEYQQSFGYFHWMAKQILCGKVAQCYAMFSPSRKHISGSLNSWSNFMVRYLRYISSRIYLTGDLAMPRSSWSMTRDDPRHETSVYHQHQPHWLYIGSHVDDMTCFMIFSGCYMTVWYYIVVIGWSLCDTIVIYKHTHIYIQLYTHTHIYIYIYIYIMFENMMHWSVWTYADILQ